jgi:16S rRNA (uracil1498-N3)-methyltransferase
MGRSSFLEKKQLMSNHRKPSFRTLGCERDGCRLVLSPEESHHLATVCRLQPGQEVWLLDEDGLRRLAEYTGLRPDGRCELRLCGKPAEAGEHGEAKAEIELFQALPKPKTMDTIIRAATELGVRVLTVVHSERSHRVRSPQKAERRERWKRVAGAACKQSGRSRLPIIRGAVDFEEALSLQAGRPGLMLAEDRIPAAVGFKEAVKQLAGDRISVFIGPEGGFSPREVRGGLEAGLRIIRLGDRILRTETAAQFALSVLVYELEV